MTDRRSFLRACLAAGGLTFVPKALDRYKWVASPTGLLTPCTQTTADTNVIVLYRKIQVAMGQSVADGWKWHTYNPGTYVVRWAARDVTASL